jgi:hypothetical protein
MSSPLRCANTFLLDNVCQHSPYHAKSIDELLEMYRPTQNSILECIADLEDHTLISTNAGHEHSMARYSALHSAESKGGPLLQCVSHCFLSHKTNDEQPVLEVMNTCRRSRRRQLMSMNEKEDRRRNQNREAQRRYRERNMLSTIRIICGGPLNHQKGLLSPPRTRPYPVSAIYRN